MQYEEASYEELSKKLPALPANVRYVWHRNSCYDWGAWGWLLLRSGQVQINKYRYVAGAGAWCCHTQIAASSAGHSHF